MQDGPELLAPAPVLEEVFKEFCALDVDEVCAKINWDWFLEQWRNEGFRSVNLVPNKER